MLSRVVLAQGEADAQPMMFDAAPADTMPAALPPDASIVKPPAGSTLPPIPNLDDDVPGFFLASYRWVASGNGWMILVPILMAFVWIASRPNSWPASKIPWLKSRRGKLTLLAATALLGSFIHAIAATGGPPGLAALQAAGLAALGAIGGFSGIKNLIQG